MTEQMSDESDPSDLVKEIPLSTDGSLSNRDSAPLNADPRLRRIDELQTEALANPDALSANLGASNAALLRMGYRFEQAFEVALANSASLAEGLDRLSPRIDTFLKIMRQVERTAQFEERRAAGHKDHKSQ